MKRKITRKVVRPIIYMLTGSSGVGKTKTTITIHFGDQSSPKDHGPHSILWIASPYRASLRSFAEAFFTMVDESIRRKRRPQSR